MAARAATRSPGGRVDGIRDGTRASIYRLQSWEGDCSLSRMVWYLAAAVGCFGGFAVEGLQFAAAVRRCKNWPWRRRGEPPFGPFITSVVIRLGVSSGVATIAVEAEVVNGTFGAFAAGVAAPLIVEQLARQFPALASPDAAGQTFIPHQPRQPAPETAATSQSTVGPGGEPA